jgi:hypothetical protein
MNILSLIILALIGEALWETLKLTWQNGKLSIDRVGALLIGELLAIGTGLDLMAMVGVPLKIPYVGMILTGLLISRGANFIHDLLASINNVQQNTKPNVISTSAAQEQAVKAVNEAAATIVYENTEQNNPTAEASEGHAQQ